MKLSSCCGNVMIYGIVCGRDRPAESGRSTSDCRGDLRGPRAKAEFVKSVFLASAAATDLREIHDYIYEKNPKAADQLLEEVQAACDNLGKIRESALFAMIF